MRLRRQSAGGRQTPSSGRRRAAGAPLITRNTKDFPWDDPGVGVPYTL